MKYDYDLVFSARKTLSVSVNFFNKITVRCPRGYKKDIIEKFLENKASWIDKCVSANSVVLAENSVIIGLKEIFYNGKRYPLEFSCKNQFENGVIFVKNVKHIKTLFCEKLSAGFLNRLERYAGQLKVTPLSVSFKDYKAKWGCCDGYNNIVFNYRLLMLPEELQDYVAVHELCHIIKHDHSAKFWKEVAALVPDFLYKRKQLNYYSFLNSLY